MHEDKLKHVPHVTAPSGRGSVTRLLPSRDQRERSGNWGAA
jgi:hypothetical protein